MTEKVYDQREDLYAAGGKSGVKIIKRGQVPEEKTYRSTCRNCLTIVEFKRRDAKFTADQRDGDYLSVDCPVCATGFTPPHDHHRARAGEGVVGRLRYPTGGASYDNAGRSPRVFRSPLRIYKAQRAP